MTKTASDKKHDIDLTYITPRGRWYMTSWKGNVEESGGIATNIGVHFSDTPHRIPGSVECNIVHFDEPATAAGLPASTRARVRWSLSVDAHDLQKYPEERTRTFRLITVDGEDVKFNSGFTDLHSKSYYEETLTGRGLDLAQAKPAAEIVLISVAATLSASTTIVIRF
jgi:UDP-N-acetyl-2-amino-2-deoxyglucuronate dehydrogenase